MVALGGDGEPVSMKGGAIVVRLRFLAKKMLGSARSNVRALAAGYIEVEQENALLKATIAALMDGMKGDRDEC